jgi:NAD(P)-dependent dehydrogenase (short-subunit alcohol dehydrogenase family)
MDEMNLDLSGQAALITGGSRGLGKAIAGAMARKGAKILICGRKQENLDQAVADFREMGLDVFAKAAHVAKPDQLDLLFKTAEEEFGRLDILVNNVGMNILTPYVAEAEEGLWDKILETNLKASFLTIKRAVPLMKKQGGGKIINISSIAARKATPGMGIYCIAKAAVEMLTKVCAVELAQHGIKVNAVAPCMVKTKFSQPFWADEGMEKEISRTIPLGRIPDPDEVVGTVLYLASNLSGFVTGEIINVDGGSMAM